MPIDIAFGTVTLDFEDAAVPGKVGLIWDRHYSTALLHKPATPLGLGWTGRYFASLTYRHGQYEFVTPRGATEILPDAAGEVAKGGVVRNFAAFLEVFRQDTCCIVQSWDVESGEVWRYRFVTGAAGEPWPLRSIEDVTGQALDLTRDATTGRLISIRQRLERRALQLSYNREGRIDAVYLQGPSGERHLLVRYEYDDAGRQVAASDAANFADRFEYDMRGRLTREIAKAGGVYLYRYDAKGRCVMRSGLNHYSEKRLRYVEGARVTEVTDSYGRKFTYQYLPSGQTVLEVDPIGGRRTTSYDEHSRIIAKADAIGSTTRYAYDDQGNRASVKNALGDTSTVTFNVHHQPLSLTDTKGQTWRRVYDGANRVAVGIDPVGNRWLFSYDADGNLVEVANPKGSRRCQRYVNGILKSFTDWLGNETHFQFDAFGRVLERRGPLGDVTRFSYDVIGNPIRVDLPDGGRLDASFDQAGNLTRFRDANGQMTHWRYGPCNRLMERTDPMGGTVRYVWGTEHNRLEQVVNEKGETYTFFRDDSWRITRERSFDGTERRFEYDAEGHTVRHTNANGEAVIIERDALHRVIGQQLPDGQRVTFAFDPLGYLTEALNADVAVRFERDTFGRIVREVQGEHWVESRYDVTGCLIRTKTSLGHVVDYAVDANGFATQINVLGNRTVEFERNAYGKETLRKMPGGARMEQRYDMAGRLIEQQVLAPGHAASRLRSVIPRPNEPLRRSYTYDGGGALTKIEDAQWGRVNHSYDPAEHLLATLRQHGACESFEYDACDNITRMRTEAAEPKDEQLIYGPGNRLLQKGQTRYEYDKAGRRIKKIEHANGESPEVWHFEWNALDRLKSVTRPDGVTWTFRYDALGRRIEKQGPDQCHQFVWDRDLTVHELRNAERFSSWVYHGEDFVPIATIQKSQLHTIIPDHLGTPMEMVDDSGAISWSMRTNSWGGGALPPESETEAPYCPIRFQGQWLDTETGLHYNRHRYYDPACGSYISEDPVRLVGGLNLYHYSRNPVNSADPLGLAPNPEYYPPDSQGRPTGGFAEVNQSSLGTGSRATVDPPGWVSGEHPDHQQRSHLIAANHGGSGSDNRNVVALTSGSNHPGMRVHEDAITAHVRAGNTVLVEVTAHYIGDSKVPDHVKIYAIDQHGNVIVDEKVANGQLQDHKACGCS